VGLLLRSGAFGAAEQQAVAIVLGAYAVGLVGFASVKLLSSAHFAMQDYRSPLRASIASLVVSAAAAIALAYPFRRSPWAAAAIAFGSAAGSFVNVTMLLRGLTGKLGTLYTPAMWQGTRRIVLASLIAAVVALPVRWWLRQSHPMIGAPPTLATFGLAYLFAAWGMGSREASRLLRLAPRGGAS
jgi:putative peptidoglycan lipid II flippase